MKVKQILFICLGLIVALASCGVNKKAQESESDSPEKSSILVAYFSATGTTRDAATKLADVMDGTLYEIVPETPYSEADLDWRDSTSRSSVEMHNRAMRPAMKDSVMDLEKYDVIFLGYPNWWNTAPTIINTFIETNNLNGKTVIPFMTSGGGDIVNSEEELKTAYPAVNWQPGKLLNNVTEEQLEQWKDSLGF